MDRAEKIRRIEEVRDATLSLIALYSKDGLTIPFGLKGNLGEFFVHAELLRQFPNSKVEFRGGAFPGVDILVDERIKIQVKTQIKTEQSVLRFRN
jgi:predicted AAA+ superfamily ATPase